MRKRKAWKSKITEVRRNKLKTYGHDQDDIMRSFSYEEMVFLLLTGRKPSAKEARMFLSVILSHCSHGITGQSTLAVRMGADTRASLLNSVLGGFLVGSGFTHQGSLETTMNGLKIASEEVDLSGYIENHLSRAQRIPGYGHRYHDHDPRAKLLMEIAEENEFGGKYMHVAKEIESVLYLRKGIRMNIEAAGGSILLDLGFPPEIGSLIILIGRGPMLAAAYLERLQEDRRAFQKVVVTDIVGG